MGRYIIQGNHLTDAEKDNKKESAIANFQQNETFIINMNSVNNETNNKLKQSINDCIKTSITENKYNK